MTTHKTLSALQDRLQVAAGQVRAASPLPRSLPPPSLCTEISTSLGEANFNVDVAVDVVDVVAAERALFLLSPSLSHSLTLSCFHLRRVSRKAKKLPLPLPLALCLPARRDINK